jgi:hypothetical protein
LVEKVKKERSVVNICSSNKHIFNYIEDKLHVVALRSETLGYSSNLLDYNTLLSKMQSLNPNLRGMRVITNYLATMFQQLLCNGMSIKQALSKIKATSNNGQRSLNKTHINSLLYCTSYVLQLNTSQYKGYITIYTNPAISYIPSIRIILRYPTKRCLRHFERLFPNFLISKAEFTLDIMCNSPEETRSLFKYIMHHLFIPHRRRESLKSIGEHGEYVDIHLKTNHAFKISYLKIYERGVDNKRKKLANGKYGWDASDIDRIRLEFDITNKIMRQWGAKTHVVQRGKRCLQLVTLGDFLNTSLDPKTYLNISFKTISSSKGPSKKIKKGLRHPSKRSIFLLSYFTLNNSEKRKMIDQPSLQILKDALFNQIEIFNKNWFLNDQYQEMIEDHQDINELNIEEDNSIFEQRAKDTREEGEEKMEINIPKTQEKLIEEGKKNLQQGNVRKALKLFMKVDESECNREMFNEVFTCRSIAHFLLKDYKQALINLECVNNHDINYFSTKGIILGKLGNIEDALANYEQALQLDDSIVKDTQKTTPKDTLIYFNRGQLYMQYPKYYEKALNDFNKVISYSIDNKEKKTCSRIHQTN